MSLRVIMAALLFLAVAALGLIAVQISLLPRLEKDAPPRPDAPVAGTVPYLVAARPLPPGTLARADDFVARAVPSGQLPPDAVIDTANTRVDLNGALVGRFLETGTPLRQGDVTRPRDRGFLAAVLPQGFRAVSIAVDAVSGVAGLIWPGDRVDVILTQEFPLAGADPKRMVTSETILTDMKVVAVDQDLAQGAPASGKAGRPAATVTLAVTSDQAEKIAVSTRLGHLSLAVRPASDASHPVTISPGGVTGADVSPSFARAVGGSTTGTGTTGTGTTGTGTTGSGTTGIGATGTGAIGTVAPGAGTPSTVGTPGSAASGSPAAPDVTPSGVTVTRPSGPKMRVIEGDQRREMNFR